MSQWRLKYKKNATEREREGGCISIRRKREEKNQCNIKSSEGRITHTLKDEGRDGTKQKTSGANSLVI